MAFIQSEHFCRRDWCIFSAERENYFPLSYTHRADILLLIYLEANDPDSRPEKTEDALLELRAYAEQKKFDVLLVPQFACIGRVPVESFYAAAFFERMGIEVWDAIEGRIINRPC